MSAVVPLKSLNVESDTDSEKPDLPDKGTKGARRELKLPDISYITASLNAVDPNRVEGKRLTTVDVGDVMQLKYKKEQGTYKGKVLSVTSYTNVT